MLAGFISSWRDCGPGLLWTTTCAFANLWGAGVRFERWRLDKGIGMSARETFDYIIVGAGSSGCVVANRLSASGRHSVLLIEAGGRDTNPWIHVPLGYGKHFTNPAVNWLYTSEPDAATANRQIAQPRGKVLGGSSSINGLVYIRGQREDYDHWRQLGNAGWGFDDVLAYFRKSEDNERGADDYHGAGGELAVSNCRIRHPLADAFIAAGEACGYPRTDDHNGPDHEGFGYVQTTQRNGRRSSAASAFLRPAKGRANLKIVTDAHVTRVLVSGREAAGVEWRQGNRLHEAEARGEVILSGGALNSPQLLQLSGIGPAEHLKGLGIAPVVDLPGVGANLQDHYNGRLVYRVRGGNTLNDVMKSPFLKVREGLRYALTRSGFLTLSTSVAAGFVRTSPEVASPDAQLGIALFSGDKAGDPLHDFSGISIIVRHLRQLSRGEVMITSSDPLAPPAIRPRYLTVQSDVDGLVSAMMIGRRIMEAEPMRPHLEAEVLPGPDCRSEADMEHFVRSRGGISFHPAGTCKMGEDALAVVDERLCVRGVGRLRVVDASIMPTLISGNTNAPAIMIGEKGADMILADS